MDDIFVRDLRITGSQNGRKLHSWLSTGKGGSPSHFFLFDSFTVVSNINIKKLHLISKTYISVIKLTVKHKKLKKTTSNLVLISACLEKRWVALAAVLFNDQIIFWQHKHYSYSTNLLDLYPHTPHEPSLYMYCTGPIPHQTILHK